MTALVARQPLHALSMSSIQRPPRRLSARLQEREDAADDNYQSKFQLTTKAATSLRDAPKTDSARGTNSKKRKNAYDEDDDGFTFTRVKKKKQKDLEPELSASKEPQHVPAPFIESNGVKVPIAGEEARDPPQKKRRNKMSFSTPNPKEVAPVRRSKRLSDEHDLRQGSPPLGVRRKALPPPAAAVEEKREPEPQPAIETTVGPPLSEDQIEHDHNDVEQEHAATKIALPFADTPVIRRNKAMRENKSGKGERRSSLGLRGRRASSLIETGNSNALPHAEVETPDFYKHIESEGLPEPRRMRQLLNWCATRALDQKPIGAGFEDASAISAARVIEEELLKELSNRSELSDWFAREDVPVQPQVITERQNPKNQQNAEKLAELGEQIRQLRAEKDALESLLQSPAIPDLEGLGLSDIEPTLLDDVDASLLRSLHSGTDVSKDISGRLKALQQNLGPTIDAFADGVHKVGQYRDAAENMAGRVLLICSEKLAERDKESRNRALDQAEDMSPRRDLHSVLRGLSRVDR